MLVILHQGAGLPAVVYPHSRKAHLPEARVYLWEHYLIAGAEWRRTFVVDEIQSY